MWSPSPEERAEIAAPPAAGEPGQREEDRRGTIGDEQALDDFFDDSDNFDEDRRIGGRLRRRR